MQEIFENLGKRIGETIDEVGKKAEDTLEVQKYKSKIHSLKRCNERDYMDIGKLVFEQFKKGELADLDFVSFCEEIQKRDGQIEACSQEIDRIRGV